jgi:hypothetical protein
MDVPRISGTRRPVSVGLAAGAAGLIATLFGFISAPRAALASYLTAYAYFAGLFIGALLLLMTFHATNARWMVVVRRALESMTLVLPLFALLFIPIALQLPTVYPWARTPPHLGEAPPELLATKAQWLKASNFVGRAALYFILFVGASEMLSFWSRRQDETGAIELTVWQRKIGAAALPVLGFATTFAAFDWLMSLDPAWASTIFGLYWFGGSFLGALAMLVVATTVLDRGGPLAGLVRPAHYHSLGKLMFAFVCFWAYIAFSQFMLIWIANKPEENPWYAVRIGSAYLPVALALLFGKFAIPFFVLLSKRIKTRPVALSCVAAWILCMQYVDIYWLVMPVLRPESGLPWWTDLAALVGVGGLSLAVFLIRAEGHPPLPVRDPYLAESLRYSKA